MMNERTFSWKSPDEVSQALIKLDKEDRRKFFSEMKIQDVPIGSLMGFTKIKIDKDGHASFFCIPEEYHYNPMGSVHGGLAATMLDSCNSISAQCNLDKDFISLTTDIRVNYLRPLSTSTGEVVAKGRIEKMGRKVIFVSGELTDNEGKVYATASSTELVIQV